jgi:hypothetical protein
MTMDQIRAHHDQMAASFSTGTLTVAGNPAPSDQLSVLVGSEIREILRAVEAALETSNRKGEDG